MRKYIITFIRRVRELGIIAVTIVVYLIFAFIQPFFLKYTNMITIVYYLSYLSFAAMALTIILICGEVDLSVGAVFSLTSVFLSNLVNEQIVDVWSATLLTFLFGVSLGFINAFLAVILEIPSLVVTLGTMLLYSSIGLAISKGYSYAFHPPEIYKKMFGGFLIGSRTELPAIPTPFLWIVAVAFFLHILLNHSRFGNWVMATGDNKWAAIATGVPVKRVKTTCFIISSLLMTLGGIITISRLEGADPLMGSSLPFEGIGAAVIGGASLSGGYGSIIGTIIGALLMSLIQNGLALIGVHVFFYQGAIGSVIVGASLLNIFLERRRQKV